MPPHKVFISYSHEDKVWLKRFVDHLGVSADEVVLDLWDDRRVAIGAEWLHKIETAIAEAHAAVLLVSPPFLSSGFIRRVEVPLLLERRSRDGLRVFPVLIRSCNWQVTPWLSTLQIRPSGAKPLAKLKGDDRDSAMATITREIRDLLLLPSFPPQPVARPPEPAGKAALAALHQLPPPPADFTGRQEELADLRRAVEQGGATISGLRGMGGIGKTALALKLAEELKPCFPDAQIYLDLKGVSPEPLTPSQAMAHVVRSFHPDAKLPETSEELASLYRSVLDGKRVLLLMDNAAGREQAEPLIPPTGCLLLATSRLRFTLPGLVAKDLDEMTPEEAHDLLLQIEPRIGESVGEISRLCGCLPMALRLAGSALAERPDLSPIVYARRLEDAQTRLELVEASFSLSEELLSKDLCKHWRELGIFPGTFDADAAAAVWQLTAGPTEKVLGALVKNSLVDWAEGRYGLHDLARVFAEARLTEVDRSKARRRHAEHYVGVLAAANGLYRGGETLLQGLRLFDREWNNIQAGQAWAAEWTARDEQAARLCNEYSLAGVHCLDLRQAARERIGWIEIALAAARHLGNRAAEGRHLGCLGNAYTDLGNPRRALEYYGQWIQITRDSGDRHGEGQALGNMGIANAHLGYLDRALEYFEDHLQIAREIGDRRSEGRALGNMGQAYRGLGDSRRAGEHLGQVLQIAREAGDRINEGISCWNLGELAEAEGDLERAVELMQVCVDIEREIGHPDAEEDAARVDELRARLQKSRASEDA